MASEQEYPEAGMYRTAYAHPKNPQAIRERLLVYFSPKSDQGPPIVLPPERLQNFQWSFATRGFLVDDLAWAQALIPLRPQGFYQLTQDLVVGNGQNLPAKLLVQLTYTQNGEAVVHAGVAAPDGSIVFAREGLLLSDLQLDTLEQASFRLAMMQPPPQAAAAPSQPIS